MKRKIVSGIMLALLIFSLIGVYIIGVTAQETHDISVVQVTPSRTSVRLCELVNITVVVENQGTENETFDVTVYYGNTAIEMKTISNLTTGQNTFLTFTWNTTSVTEEVYTSPGHRKTYAIKATVSTVAGETDVEDNTRVSSRGVEVFVPHHIAVIPQRTVDPTLTLGKNFTISIYTDYNGSDIWGYQFVLTYNPAVLHGVEVVNGDLITEGDVTFVAGTFNNTIGKLRLTLALSENKSAPLPYPPVSNIGPGVLAYVTFKVVSEGDSYITLEDHTLIKGITEDGYGDEYNIIDYVTDLRPEDPGPGDFLHGYFRNTVDPITHDIAILSVTPSPTWIETGEPVNVTVVVKNNGTRTEKGITIKLYYDYISPNWLIETQTISTLEAGANTSLTFTWNTTDVWPRTYQVRVVADSVHGETDTGNNALNEWVIVSVFYIRSNGSIDPFWAPILSVNNVTYTFTSDILNVSIVVERDDIVVDGAGYTLQAEEDWHSYVGIDLLGRNNVTIKNAKIKGFGNGIRLKSSSNNTIYHNNFIDNTKQVYILESGYGNLWDAGYPSGGNYWSDYEERYPDAEELDGLGIWDTPYIIDKNNQDNYPLMNPWRAQNLPPVVDFEYSPAEPTIQDGVHFTDASEDSDGTIVSWLWDFGDGKTSTLQTPTHQYSDKGSYTITLTVTDNDNAQNNVTKTITIYNVAPTASFTFSLNTPMINKDIQFTDESTDPEEKNLSCLWDFGDGTTSTKKNPVHIYQSEGTYNVTLTVTDDEGLTSTLSKTLSIKGRSISFLPWFVLGGVAVGAIILVAAIVTVRRRK